MLIRLEIFIKRKLREFFVSYYQKKDRKNLKNSDFVLISRNCWGGQVYQQLGLPYNSPFVGLFFFGPCYMKLLRNFDAYMNMDLGFIEKSRYPEALNDYPIGVLGDVEIHFQHYGNKEEAKQKWEKRKKRMMAVEKDNYFYTICDRRGTTIVDILEFHTFNFKNKLSFSFDKIEGLTNRQHIKFNLSKSNIERMPPNGKKRFKLSFLYFDIVRWLNEEIVIRTRFKE